MTIAVANINVSTDSFGQWITKTNVLADALSNYAVTTNSNTAVGNAAVSGSFSANVIYGSYLAGGTPSLPAAVNAIANVSFSANASFKGLRTDLGLASNVAIQGGNSTFRVLTVNTAASNTISVGKITFGDLSDAYVASPGNGHVLVYSTANSYWYNTNAVNIDATTGTITASGNVVATGFQFSNGQTFSALQVFYANGVQAFP